MTDVQRFEKYELPVEEGLQQARQLGWPILVSQHVGYGEVVIYAGQSPIGLRPAIVVNAVVAVQLETGLGVWDAILELVRRRVDVLAARALDRIDQACDVDSLEA